MATTALPRRAAPGRVVSVAGAEGGVGDLGRSGGAVGVVLESTGGLAVDQSGSSHQGPGQIAGPVHRVLGWLVLDHFTAQRLDRLGDDLGRERLLISWQFDARAADPDKAPYPGGMYRRDQRGGGVGVQGRLLRGGTECGHHGVDTSHQSVEILAGAAAR